MSLFLLAGSGDHDANTQQEQEQEQTLRAALALIDDYHRDVSVSPVKPSAHAPVASEAPTTRTTDVPTRTDLLVSSSSAAPQASRRRGARKSNPEALRRQRERKKAETQLLRDEVAALEARRTELEQAQQSGRSLRVFLQRLGRLRRASSDAEHSESNGRDDDDDDIHDDGDSDLLVALTQPSDAAVWREVAALQAQGRLEAQALNTALRAAVERQRQLVQSIEALLRSKHSRNGLELLHDAQQQQLLHSHHPRHRIHHTLTHGATADVLESLQQRVLELYALVERVFSHARWSSTAGSLACAIRFKPHATRERVVEMRMDTPLACSTDAAVGVIWRSVVTASAPTATPHYFMQRQQLTASSFQKRFGLRVAPPPSSSSSSSSSPADSPIELYGSSFGQIFVKGDQHYCVWTSVLETASAASLLRAPDVYREQGWMTVGPSSTHLGDPARSRFRVHYEAFCDSPVSPSSASGASDLDTVRAEREAVLRALGHRTRSYHQLMQNALQDRASGFQMQPLALLPPVSNMC